jgi:hypothetical protein
VRDIQSLFENLQARNSVQAGQEALRQAGVNIPANQQVYQNNEVTAAQIDEALHAVQANILKPKSMADSLLGTAARYAPLVSFIATAAGAFNDSAGAGITLFKASKALCEIVQKHRAAQQNATSQTNVIQHNTAQQTVTQQGGTQLNV